MRRVTLLKIQDYLKYPTKLLYSTKTATTSTRDVLGAPAKRVENEEPLGEHEFRTLELYKKSIRQVRKKREQKEVPPPRHKKMSVTQDWPSAWPVARTFHPASVPLPLHQGLVPPNKPVPNKYGNLELMKIPNFLHLTPPAIQRHCEALKKFCTPWPEGLTNEKVIDEHYPIEIMSSDYCHSTPSIRDPRARIITMRFKLSALNLDTRAKDKFLRLVGNRYDRETGMVTIVADCCPLRVQNFDFAMYLITALYHESWNVEDWESEKSEADMETYIWEKSVSKDRVSKLLTSWHENQEAQKPEYLNKVKPEVLNSEEITVVEPIKKFSEAVTRLHNEGERFEDVEEYGKSVRALFNLPAP